MNAQKFIAGMTVQLGKKCHILAKWLHSFLVEKLKKSALFIIYKMTCQSWLNSSIIGLFFELPKNGNR